MPREFDQNGWMQVRDNPIAKVGVFPYLGSEIKGAPDQSSIYRIYRPAEELQKPATLESFKLLPFIDDHTPIGPVYGIAADEKGVQGMIGEQVYFSDPWVRGNLKVVGGLALSNIGRGKVELSPGYDCDYDWTPGVFNGESYDAIQRNIRANHLALVDEGRTGPDLVVQDHLPSALRVGDRITIDTAELIAMEFTPEQLAQIEALIAKVLAAQQTTDAEAPPAVEDKPTTDAAEDMPVEAAPAVTAEQGDAAEQAVAVAEEAQAAVEQAAEAVQEMADAAEEIVMAADDATKLKAARGKLAKARAKHTAAKAAQSRIAQDAKSKGMMAAFAKLQQEVAELRKVKAAPTMDAATLMQQVGDRDQLASRVSQHIGSFDHSRMTVDGVAEYALGKIGLKAPKGQERIALDSWLHGRKAEHENIITADSFKAPSLDDAWAKQGEGK